MFVSGFETKHSFSSEMLLIVKIDAVICAKEGSSIERVETNEPAFRARVSKKASTLIVSKGSHQTNVSLLRPPRPAKAADHVG